jgi:hypothetical protein
MHKLLAIFALSLILPLAGEAHAKKNPNLPSPSFYRDLTLKVRPEGIFRVYMPDGRHQEVNYKFQFGAPVYEEPKINDMTMGIPNNIERSFWDRILLQDGSYFEIGGERLPLTCIFISGQDNRFANIDSPLFPEFIMKIYIIANDFACQGPIRPGWPSTGGKKENWDTYLHYEVRDPTIMLPTDALIRYRWNETSAVLIDKGN